MLYLDCFLSLYCSWGFDTLASLSRALLASLVLRTSAWNYNFVGRMTPAPEAKLLASPATSNPTRQPTCKRTASPRAKENDQSCDVTRMASELRLSKLTLC